MALQEMTQVPFRCVDEINQGMDERNEKAVWEILVDSANDHSAQFFYLAPKYPHGLQFEKNMHIHVCFNGNMDIRNESDNFIDVDAYIKKKQSSWALKSNYRFFMENKVINKFDICTVLPPGLVKIL